MALRGLGAGHSGTIPLSNGGYEYLYVAIDKFTKWPEAVPVIKVTKNTAL